MVSALNQDFDGLEKATQDLIRTASRHGLQAWKDYGEIFKLWAMVQHKRYAEAIRMEDPAVGMKSRASHHFNPRFTYDIASFPLCERETTQ
jgi:hypothetical protein